MVIRSPARKLVRTIRSELRTAGDPRKAGPMQAYMKSEMPYHGVQTPARRRIVHGSLRENPLPTFDVWHEAVAALWDEATHREERYAAIDVAAFPHHTSHQRMKAMPLYERAIVEGAWWDYVDALAARVRAVLERHPSTLARRMRSWSRSPDIWKRRTSIICQLGRAEATDVSLLLDCIRASIDRPEFFLRKGIGWALREHAKSDPSTVIRFVREERERLSSLSKREALRNLVSTGRISSIP